MKIKTSALIALSAICLTATSALASFTYDPTTYNSVDATKGVIWFDTVGTMSYDGNGNPANITGGTLGNSTVQVDFLFTFSGGTARSIVYALDAASGGISAFGTVSGRISPETVATANNLAGLSGTYQVEAWVGGASYGDPLNTKSGISAATAITFGGTPTGQLPVLPSPVNNFANFAVTAAVPEPTTLALGLFGAAGLLIRRRK
jgi:hypothetical protein